MARKSCSVTALAQFMGLHRQTVSRLIHSNQPMDISQLEQIGMLLGVDPVTLVARATAA
jgi:plasmid maintenance system antidote protein VapI